MKICEAPQGKLLICVFLAVDVKKSPQHAYLKLFKQALGY
jgi:hypothetical protein